MGIVVGVFVIGMSVSYVIFMTASNSDNIVEAQNQQIIQKVMEEPQIHQQVMELMTMDPDIMDNWFKNTKHVKQMAEIMKEDHEFMQEMMVEIIEDPSLRLQMIGHMTENQDAVEQMKKLTEKTNSFMNDMNMGSGDNVDFSNIRLTNLTPTSVTIVGTTNIAANCQVEYGLNMKFTNTASDSTMGNMDMPHETHMVLITELTPNTSYDYRFKATYGEQIFYSDVKSFTTPDM